MATSIGKYWHSLKNLGVTTEHSIQEKRQKWFFNIITFIGTLTAIPLVISAFPVDPIAAYCHITWATIAVFSLVIHAKVNFKTARFMLFIGVFIFGGYASMRLGRETYPHIGSLGIVASCIILHDLKKEWGYILLFMALEIFMVVSVEGNYFQVAPYIETNSLVADRSFIFLGAMAFVMVQVVFYINMSLTDVRSTNDELRSFNQELSQSNQENVTLLKEIHHRVKNNLQIITSLLRLQASELKDQDSIDKFTSSINRVKSISTLHELIYSSENLQNIDVEKYVHLMAANLISTYDPNKKVNIEIYSDLNNAQNDSFMPIALILNELISNSLKHGFAETEDCKIKMSISKQGDNKFRLIYEDNGKWFDEGENNSFGTELIQTLAEQINGHIDRDSRLDHSHYTLNFEVNDFE